jgi:hypothetical protein
MAVNGSRRPDRPTDGALRGAVSRVNPAAGRGAYAKWGWSGIPYCRVIMTRRRPLPKRSERWVTTELKAA